MLKRQCLVAPLVLAFGVFTSAQGPRPFDAAQGRRVAMGDWPEARGPQRDGTSGEKGLVEQWALNGQNFLWRAPFGGRSAPIVMGNRIYVQNPTGLGDTLQERLSPARRMRARQSVLSR